MPTRYGVLLALLVALALPVAMVEAQSRPRFAEEVASDINEPVVANTNELASNLSPVCAGFYRLQVASDTALKVSLYKTDGSVTNVRVLNNDTNLTADAEYTFEWGAGPAWDYNFQASANGTLDYKITFHPE